MASFWKNGLQIFTKQLTQNLNTLGVPKGCRPRMCGIPRKRNPEWLPVPEREPFEEALTEESKSFLDNYVKHMQDMSPLKSVIPIINTPTKKSKRTGLIAKKIGVYPMWLKDGTRVTSTLLQVPDNEVVSYIPPEKFNPVIKRKYRVNYGSLIIGAQNIDPQLLTKEYYEIFTKAGLMPKKFLGRFAITPDAALQTGTRLSVDHFQPGDVVDIRAKTIGRGFQGVMKRWGFKGMPASHGQTKTHRRPGNVGSGSSRARVVPGTKMPGHMGHRWRVHRGLRVLRVSPEHSVIWLLGHNVPGEINTHCYLYDTILPNRRSVKSRFPTYFPDKKEVPLKNLYADDVHNFENPSITFSNES